MKFLKDKAAARGIAVFYAIALAVSFLSLYVVPRACAGAEQTVWWQMLTGAGPALGALVAVVALRRKMYCGLAGSSALKSLACVALPAAALAIFTDGGLRAAQNRCFAIKLALLSFLKIKISFFDNILSKLFGHVKCMPYLCIDDKSIRRSDAGRKSARRPRGGRKRQTTI